MNFEEHTGAPIGVATGAKQNTNKKASYSIGRGVLGKRPELIEAARMFLDTSVRRWTNPCSMCRAMITRQVTPTSEIEESMHPTIRAVREELKNLFVGAIPIQPEEEVVIRISRRVPGVTEIKYSVNKATE